MKGANNKFWRVQRLNWTENLKPTSIWISWIECNANVKNESKLIGFIGLNWICGLLTKLKWIKLMITCTIKKVFTF